MQSFFWRNARQLCLGLGVLAMFWMGPASISAEEEAGSPYDEIWSEVADLLETKEYASALEIIQDAEKDPELKEFKERLKVDRRDVERLIEFSKLVREQAAQLKPRSKLKVGNLEYTVVNYVSDAKGDRLVLETGSGSSKTEKSLDQLDSKTWLAITGETLSSSPDDRYVVGIFLASVDRGDRKAARAALNAAAEEKIPVSHWTARIDAESDAKAEERETKKAQKEDEADPILGTWRIVVGEGKNAKAGSLTFRANGRTSARGGKWRAGGGGRYVVTMPNGSTAHLEMGPAGEGMRGKLANGAPVRAIRQAADKR